jgi:hypothetical protein
MRVEARQQRQTDPTLGGGGDNASGGFGWVGVLRAVRCFVHVVELTDRSEAGLQHLEIGQCRDVLDIVRRHPSKEAIHHCPTSARVRQL